MDYFLSHIGVIFIAAAFVAVCAVAWWYLTDKNARLKRERAEARRRAAAAAASQIENADAESKAAEARAAITAVKTEEGGAKDRADK